MTIALCGVALCNKYFAQDMLTIIYQDTECEKAPRLGARTLRSTTYTGFQDT